MRDARCACACAQEQRHRRLQLGDSSKSLSLRLELGSSDRGGPISSAASKRLNAKGVKFGAAARGSSSNPRGAANPPARPGAPRQRPKRVLLLCHRARLTPCSEQAAGCSRRQTSP